MSDIENDFEKVAEQINEEIRKSAEAMKKANELAKQAGLEYMGGSCYLLEDCSKEDLEKITLINFDPLFTELGKAGWQTSSLHC